MPRSVVDRGGTEAGAREFHIEIEKLTEAQADSNFPTEDWVSLVKLWASREYVSLDERFQSQQTIATAVIRWTIPYRRDMDPDEVQVAKARRLKYKGRVYNILSAEMKNRGDGKGIVLVTEANV